METVGDIGITIRKVAELFQKLKSAYEAKDDIAAEDALEEVKTKIIFFPTFLNVNAPSPTRAQELLLVREILEHAVLLSARKKDLNEVERYFNMLQTYYRDITSDAAAGPAVVPESSIMYMIIGLNLMRLLISHRVAEYHSEFEKIDQQQQQRSAYIRFAAQMERYLMEGSYNKLLHARSQAPSNEYLPIVELLEGTVRQEVARCLPAAYGAISVADAKAMLMMRSDADVTSMAERCKWTQSADKSSYVFQRDVDASRRELPFMQILNQNIQFVAELQRVV